VETLPTLVKAGVLVQVVIPAVPEIDHVVVPFGSTVEVPVTVSVNVIVEFKEPPPEPATVTVGVTLAITTLTGDEAASEV